MRSGGRRSLTVAGLVGLVGWAALALAPTAGAGVGGTTLFDSSTPGAHADAAEVPADICFVTITTDGGSGGAFTPVAAVAALATTPGGSGAHVSARFPVNPGDVLDAFVAGVGQNPPTGSDSGHGGNGGLGGGGGGGGGSQGNAAGAGGGGASVVSMGSQPLVVAGGGGGSSNNAGGAAGLANAGAGNGGGTWGGGGGQADGDGGSSGANGGGGSGVGTGGIGTDQFAPPKAGDGGDGNGTVGGGGGGGFNTGTDGGNGGTRRVPTSPPLACARYPNLRSPLRAEGLLTRDPRMRERKKYGQPGARKRFQYSKR